MSGPERRPRVSILTLGCAKNVADTDLLAGQLLREGIGVTPEPAEADAILINTCAFLTASQEESIEAILQMVERKKEAPGCRLVVIGCLAQRHGASLIEEIPEIDLLVGPGEVHTLAPRLRALLGNGGDPGGRVHLGGTDRVEERWEIRVVSQGRHSAYIKISEGCDRACSFCVIPKLRGGHRSRTREGIAREVATLAASGVREINLVAQELTAYGIDLYGRPSLAELLADLDAIDGVAWIRLLYTYPSNWSDRLLEAIRNLGHVVPYIDLPIQHVSEPILRAMRRPPFDRTRALLDRFRKEIPGVTVRSTLITGFPGEGEGEFRELLDFVSAYRFDALGVFAYSPEEGTDACRLPEPVPEVLREERREKVLALQRRVSLDRNRARVGRKLTLLLDAVDGKGDGIARHAGQAPEVDGVTRLRGAGAGGLRPGCMMDAVVTDADAYDLEARPAGTREGG